MKNKKLILAAAIAVLAVFMLSCGGNSPKALAKETYEIMAEAFANPSKEEELGRRMKAIEAKVEKMSTLKQLAYSAELMRISAEQGGEMLQSAFKGSETEAAIKEFGEQLNSPEAQAEINAFNDSMNEALNSKELQDALKAFGDAFGQN